MRNSFISLLILFRLVMSVQDLSAKRQPAGMLIEVKGKIEYLSLIHISEPTRP